MISSTSNQSLADNLNRGQAENQLNLQLQEAHDESLEVYLSPMTNNKEQATFSDALSHARITATTAEPLTGSEAQMKHHQLPEEIQMHYQEEEEGLTLLGYLRDSKQIAADGKVGLGALGATVRRTLSGARQLGIVEQTQMPLGSPAVLINRVRGHGLQEKRPRWQICQQFFPVTQSSKLVLASDSSHQRLAETQQSDQEEMQAPPQDGTSVIEQAESDENFDSDMKGQQKETKELILQMKDFERQTAQEFPQHRRRSREMPIVEYVKHFEKASSKLQAKMATVILKSDDWWKLRKQQIALEARLRNRWHKFSQPRKLEQSNQVIEALITECSHVLSAQKQSQMLRAIKVRLKAANLTDDLPKSLI